MIRTSHNPVVDDDTLLFESFHVSVDEISQNKLVNHRLDHGYYDTNLILMDNSNRSMNLHKDQKGGDLVADLHHSCFVVVDAIPRNQL